MGIDAIVSRKLEATLQIGFALARMLQNFD